MCCVRVLFVLLHIRVYGDVHAYFEVHVLLREHLLEMIKLDMIKHDMTLRHGITSRDIMCHYMPSVFLHPCHLRMSKVFDTFFKFIRI